jgi:hypothetical protein
MGSPVDAPDRSPPAMTTPPELDGKSRIQAALDACRAAEDCLFDVVREELDKAARRAGLDEMKFLLVTHLYRGDVELDPGQDDGADEVRELEALYLQQIPVGFEGLWSADRGWYA